MTFMMTFAKMYMRCDVYEFLFALSLFSAFGRFSWCYYALELLWLRTLVLKMSVLIHPFSLPKYYSRGVS